MPRRALFLLTALVLALHWLALAGLPRGITGAGEPERMAFHTRMLQPPPPEAAPAAPAAAARPAPRPHKRPARKPAPPPEPLSEQTAADSPPVELASAAQEAADAPLTAPEPSSDLPPEPLPEPSSEPLPEPSSGPPQETAAAPEPAQPPPAEPVKSAEESGPGAGVEILPPGAGGGAASSETPPVRLPPPAQLDFEVRGVVKGFRYSASAQLAWHPDGARYEASQRISAFLLGSRSQSSVGRITAQGLQPERFTDKARNKEQTADFNFDTHQVTFSSKPQGAAIGAGAQDRLSVFIQLGALLAAAPERYPPGTRITLTTASTRHAGRWSFSVEGPQTLDLPAGPTPALKLQRLPEPGDDQKAELWLGTDLNYLPVRIRLSQDNGDFAELSLTGRETP
jgi:hypothetical protein